MNKRSKAWIILPVAIVIIAVLGLVLSNYQKEAGLIQAGAGGRAAVAAAVTAESLVSADGGAAEYAAFSKALLVALVARRNMAVTNPAETRLDHRLASVLDFLSAVREAWQADLDHTWDPQIQGDPAYWRSLHPGVEIGSSGPLTPAAVREAYRAEAGRWLEDAVDLAG
jgi:hypothetical protein